MRYEEDVLSTEPPVVSNAQLKNIRKIFEDSEVTFKPSKYGIDFVFSGEAITKRMVRPYRDGRKKDNDPVPMYEFHNFKSHIGFIAAVLRQRPSTKDIQELIDSLHVTIERLELLKK